MNREDFPMLKQNMIYFDNGATTFKPQEVIDKMVDYYSNYTANAHRGDYDTSRKVDEEYEIVRGKVTNLLHNSDPREIVFTKGATEALNLIVWGFMKHHLQKGDEVLLTKAEHASNILPWLALAKEKGIVIRYIDLNQDHEVTMESVKKSLTPNTKVISLAHITNVVGDVRPIKDLGELCQEKGYYFVVDGAQSIPHMEVNVVEDHVDFLAFSGHKMLGPTGVGVLYGRYDLLQQTEPIQMGGGMNAFFESDGAYAYKEVPTCFEAGTPPIAEVIGLGKAIDYLQKIGLANIHAHEVALKHYFIEQVQDIPNLIIYNKNSKSGIIAFNIDGIFSQDTAMYLNHYHICVRAGNHCAKILKDEFKIKNTCRISFYLYNTKEEIDALVTILKKQEDILRFVI